MTDCACHFCQAGRVHPTSHSGWEEITSRLLKASSLDPKDRVRQFSCRTCGHVTDG